MQGTGPPERPKGVQEPAVVTPTPEASAADATPGADFGDLYRSSFTEMVRLAYLLTGSRETARDLVQDCFLRLYRAWNNVREPRAYLRRSIVNACHSHHRKQHRQRRQIAEMRVDLVELGADEMFDAIEALPYRQRAAIVLRYWHDCSEAEIAAALKCRPGTVGSLLHRGIAELREVIEP